MLEKQEKKESHKKWENLYVFTGRKSDLTTMISIAVINPMILYVFIGYVAGKKTQKKAGDANTGRGRTNGCHQEKNR